MKKKPVPQKTKAKTSTTSSVKKSVSKKSVAPQKSTKKLVVRKKKEKREFVVAGQKEAFFVKDGPALFTLLDLYNELDSMLEYQYLYHREVGDHFALWAGEVLCDDEAARGLSKAWTRKDATAFLKKHLKNYQD